MNYAKHVLLINDSRRKLHVSVKHKVRFRRLPVYQCTRDLLNVQCTGQITEYEAAPYTLISQTLYLTAQVGLLYKAGLLSKIGRFRYYTKNNG